MTTVAVETRVPGPFRLEKIKVGRTVRVHGFNRIEISLDLGFGSWLSRVFQLDGVHIDDVPEDLRREAVHCLVVLLGGKKVMVQPENEKVTCRFGRVFLAEKIYGSPIGLVSNVDRLEKPILDVTPFFLYLADHDFDVRLVHEVVNRRPEKT